jgi:hypothetical protein
MLTYTYAAVDEEYIELYIQLQRGSIYSSSTVAYVGACRNTGTKISGILVLKYLT